jgi:hypothetical protein
LLLPPGASVVRGALPLLSLAVNICPLPIILAVMPWAFFVYCSGSFRMVAPVAAD